MHQLLPLAHFNSHCPSRLPWNLREIGPEGRMVSMTCSVYHFSVLPSKKLSPECLV